MKGDERGIETVWCRERGPGGRVAAHILWLDGDVALVDTGNDSRDAHRIIHQLARLGLRLDSVRHIILTHAHADHTGGLATLRSVTNAELVAHEQEVPALASTGIVVDSRIDSDVIWEQYGGLQFLHMPGHTPGSMGLFHHRSRSLITGDAIFSAGQHLVFPPPYLCDDPFQARLSVLEMLDMELPIGAVKVSHGEPVMHEAQMRLNRLRQARRPASE